MINHFRSFVDTIDFSYFNYNNYLLDQHLLKKVFFYIKILIFFKLSHFIRATYINGPIFPAYSSKIHGRSLNTLYNNCDNYENVPCLLIIKENTKNVIK